MYTSLASLGKLFSKISSGIGAIISQPYDEVNKKRGVQWAASRIVTATAGQIFYSVIEVGDKPIDLKHREFAFTGASISADIFQSPSYTGGTAEVVHNANGFTAQPPSFDFVLKGGVSIIQGGEGVKFAPTIYAIGPTSNQSKGLANALYGSNYILKPNTVYLLRFTNTDTQTQSIAVRVEGYEGDLDFYPE